MDTTTILNDGLLLPAASFKDKGGWFLDSEFILTMGACYLLAHGLGKKVAPARTTVTSVNEGNFHIYVYTYNWVAPWHPEYYPGIFTVSVNGSTGNEVGKEPVAWNWEYAGEYIFRKGINTIALEDNSGFEGRCAFLYITRQPVSSLPSGKSAIWDFYRREILSKKTVNCIYYDFAVIGGGISGMCAAVVAARRGLKTVLIQDRSMPGGNNSSEIRVWLGGGTNYEPFGGIGNVVGEFEQQRIGHYGSVNTADLYEDDRKKAVLAAEKNLTVLYNHCLVEADTVENTVSRVRVLDILSDALVEIEAPLFVDATGDGHLGALAGADFEVTTNGHMGVSNLWHIKKTDNPAPFPPCPWAVNLKDVAFPGRKDTVDIYGHSREFSFGCWFWESGMTEDPITDAERSRDMNFRAMYGAWDTVRNVDHDYQDYELAFAAAPAGKRESRRLLGDVVLTKADFKYHFPDACVATTWNFDVHYPDKQFYAAFHEGDAFLTMDCREVFEGPYFLPYRILYSRNISNLFMAGRDVSVSHDASGTARVMRTGGLMGEVVGYAASLCRKYNCLPRDIYTEHLEEFLELLKSIERKEVAKAGNTVV